MVFQQTDLPTESDPASGGALDQEPRVTFGTPTLNDGRHLWRMARDTGVLDLNSSYAYVLWCRDFAGTSVVARVDGQHAGFITAYLRPENPRILMVWQVAVDVQHRGRRLAARMLSHLADRLDIDWVETTITADNQASDRLFRSFARDRAAELTREPLFTEEHFPDGHDTEFLYRIGRLR